MYVLTPDGKENIFTVWWIRWLKRDRIQRQKLRVWIDSQTEEEILRGVQGGKRPIAEYDNLSRFRISAGKRRLSDGNQFFQGVVFNSYGITGSIITFRIKNGLSVSVGRVMTCVLGMVVKREWEIRNFKKTPFYRVIGDFSLEGKGFQGEWKAVEGSAYYESPALYKENGFKKKEDAQKLMDSLLQPEPVASVIEKVEKKKEKKNPPLLFNLAEIQNLSSKLFKISPG